MRKVLIFSGIIISIFSCKKGGTESSKYCWECATNVTMSMDGMPAQSVSSTTSFCDKTESEAKQIEQSGTSTTTATNMGMTMTSVTKTNCTKK